MDDRLESQFCSNMSIYPIGTSETARKSPPPRASSWLGWSLHGAINSPFCGAAKERPHSGSNRQ